MSTNDASGVAPLNNMNTTGINGQEQGQNANNNTTSSSSSNPSQYNFYYAQAKKQQYEAAYREQLALLRANHAQNNGGELPFSTGVVFF